MHSNSGLQVSDNEKFGQFGRTKPRPLMAMVEITNRCNMACPLCFSNANHPADEVPLEEIKERLRTLNELAGPIPVQISGGEPTLHRDLPEVIRFARELGFRNIELITNGIRISKDPDYLAHLTERGLTAVYLQFDGLERATYLAIRGKDMTEVRDTAVDSVRRAGVCCTLAVAVTPGVNDHELGNIVAYGIENIDTVRAINFQAATRFTGRFDVASRAGGYPLPDLTREIEEQAGLPASSFRSEMLGHPLCNAMSLVYVVDGKLQPLFNFVDRNTLLRFLGDDKRTKVLDLFMGKERFCRNHFANPALWKVLVEASAIFGSAPSFRSVIAAKHILLFAKSFMERSSMDKNRIDQCSYAISGTDGVYSFCAFNNQYRPTPTR
ncbi:MAG: radical SAM protein [Verrucomicrobiota bacterium]